MGDAHLSPVVVENPDGAGPFVVVCDHAQIASLRNISRGLTEDVLKTHIAWDPGALNVARHLSARLDAPLLWPDASLSTATVRRMRAVLSSLKARAAQYRPTAR